jgi:hypothetical protein
MASANDDFHCYACNAAVSEQEILDGWCDECGKRLPASFGDTLRRRQKEAPAPVSLDIPDSPPARFAKRLLVGGVVLGVLGGLVLLFALMGVG